jgi:hypothetical protein
MIYLTCLSHLHSVIRHHTSGPAAPQAKDAALQCTAGAGLNMQAAATGVHQAAVAAAFHGIYRLGCLTQHSTAQLPLLHLADLFVGTVELGSAIAGFRAAFSFAAFLVGTVGSAAIDAGLLLVLDSIIARWLLQLSKRDQNMPLFIFQPPKGNAWDIGRAAKAALVHLLTGWPPGSEFVDIVNPM